MQNGIEFELYVMDLCEQLEPKSCKDLERLADELHQHVEIAIQDYIDDDENLKLDDYEPRY